MPLFLIQNIIFFKNYTRNISPFIYFLYIQSTNCFPIIAYLLIKCIINIILKSENNLLFLKNGIILMFFLNLYN